MSYTELILEILHQIEDPTKKVILQFQGQSLGITQYPYAGIFAFNDS